MWRQISHFSSSSVIFIEKYLKLIISLNNQHCTPEYPITLLAQRSVSHFKQQSSPPSLVYSIIKLDHNSPSYIHTSPRILIPVTYSKHKLKRFPQNLHSETNFKEAVWILDFWAREMFDIRELEHGDYDRSMWSDEGGRGLGRQAVRCSLICQLWNMKYRSLA